MISFENVAGSRTIALTFLIKILTLCLHVLCGAAACM